MVGVETSLRPYFRFFTSIFVVYTTTSFFSTALVHRLSSSAADNTDSSKLSVWAISAALSLAEMEFGDDSSKLSVWDKRAALAEFGDDAATATSSSRNLSAEFFPNNDSPVPFRNLSHSSSNNSFSSHNSSQLLEYNHLISEDEVIIAEARRTNKSPTSITSYVRAGARPNLHHDPSRVVAAIVTCGGLCPGLNNVVREITRSLKINYGAKTVYGVVGGFMGFHVNSKRSKPPIILTPTTVENIHHTGGTILGSARGNFDMNEVINFIKHYSVNQLYIIGGDGTHRAAAVIAEQCIASNLNVAVAGIPKTIDNDVGIIDRSFGFDSAVEEAVAAIRAAKTEAQSQNAVGVVKVMGRSSGFIATHASFASSDVDYVAVPEVPIVLRGGKGMLPHLLRRVHKKGFAVVVLAEGAGEELLGKSAEVDKGGNRKLPAIGDFIKGEIESYFKEESDEGVDVPVKFIDPSYMVRSVCANSSDSFLCMQLGQNAVHGAMAGFTAFTVGLVNNRMVFLPMTELVRKSPRTMNPRGRTWERIVQLTLQPNTVPEKGDS
ncbi:hypothetical protein ScalyP_jg4402 [Parmales sp. scaly parma]|nr:hypothetical protein ScalyP_jg4402 [Parmales sp. scaly parma]